MQSPGHLRRTPQSATARPGGSRERNSCSARLHAPATHSRHQLKRGAAPRHAARRPPRRKPRDPENGPRARVRASGLQAGEEAYRTARFAIAANRFEQAYQLSKFPTILFDVAQSYRRLYETEHVQENLRKSISAYRNFLMQAPNASQHPVAEKFLAMLEVQLMENPEIERNEPTPTVAKPATPKLKAFEAGPPATPVYKKWWLWTTVGAVAAVALGVGLGVGLNQYRTAEPGDFATP